MHMYNFLCSNSLLYFFLFLSTLHSVYTRDCSCVCACVCMCACACVCVSVKHMRRMIPQNPQKMFATPIVVNS